jgi:hypothetical protein
VVFGGTAGVGFEVVRGSVTAEVGCAAGFAGADCCVDVLLPDTPLMVGILLLEVLLDEVLIVGNFPLS